MDSKFRSRKFGFAVFFTFVGTVAFFANMMEPGEWTTLAGVVMGLYGAANVGERWAQK